ncbi:ABC transporter substrate-binding protein [Nocardioides sp. zg-536]|uniref:ABC transporter substrate-binding protein n=1 Tax=Nocardioides faecalis TaxID=2803858 RepID=A0A938Y4R4_9ACTN|nr:ABC transporter substrate-binding protein [Nocardioides faecalis]MBM9459993.1 ABC transporter substrate-binding protein [Nocardioides faecalis]MBS4753139.1 ABC transporter substrate-binding protein [Nocardioides faecalis]QVI58786.1 ABC transporter substrate-binding protein [Nocardioides faecalis]
MASKARLSVAAVLGAGVLLTSLTACGEEEKSAAPTSSSVISDERCAANGEAGKLTYLTSYQYAATASILDVLAAEELGYFDDLCLDVEVQPGDTAQNPQLVSAGRAAFAALGGPADVLSAVAAGADVVSVATYGNVPAIEYISLADGPIKDLKDLEGKTVGYKGNQDPPLLSMLEKAGVDTDKVEFVSVGYDPSILAQGKVHALEAYKSNEPKVLAKAGHEVTEWKPEEYGVQSSFNNLVTSSKFAEKNPTAVEDFLRATFKAYEWLSASDENLTKGLGWAEKATGPGSYDVELAKVRWQTEVELISSSQPEGTPLGFQSEEQWKPEAEVYVEHGVLKEMPDLSEAFDASYVEAIFEGTELVWGE